MLHGHEIGQPQWQFIDLQERNSPAGTVLARRRERLGGQLGILDRTRGVGL